MLPAPPEPRPPSAWAQALAGWVAWFAGQMLLVGGIVLAVGVFLGQIMIVLAGILALVLFAASFKFGARLTRPRPPTRESLDIYLAATTPGAIGATCAACGGPLVQVPQTRRWFCTRENRYV